MAIVQNPVTGRSKNAFANAIFTTILGKNVMRSKPLKVANPRTIAQQKTRKKISYLSEQAKALKNAIDIGYKKAALYMYPRNKFTSENYITLDIDNTLHITQNMQALQISKGGLGDKPTITSATVTVNNYVSVEYLTDDQVYPNTVKVVLAVIKSNGEVRGVEKNAGIYTSLHATATIQGASAGDSVYIFAYDEITMEVTNSSTEILI